MTERKARTAKTGRHGDRDVRGLCLVVTPTGGRSWVLRIQTSGRRRDIGLGGYPDVGLEAVRKKARSLREAAKAGADPIAVRDKAKFAPPTFSEAAIRCHTALSRGWGSRTEKAFLATLKLHVFPKMGNLRVDSVDEKEILAVLSPIWRDKPAAARKLRQRIATVLDYSKGMGWRSVGAPRDGLRPLLSRQGRAGNFAAMPFAQVPALVADLNTKSDTAGRLALLFAIFTAARSGEVRAARWSQIDADMLTWSRPADIMKNGLAHAVTLSPAARSVLDRAKHLRRDDAEDALVFPGVEKRMMSDMTMSKIVKPLGVTVHGFRSSFRDWAAECMMAIPDPVAEAALAHLVSDKVIAAYKRTTFLQMRRDLLDAWGQFILPPMHDRTEAV